MPGLIGWLDPNVRAHLLLTDEERVVVEIPKHWMSSIFAWVRLAIAIPVFISSWAFPSPSFWVLFVGGGVLGVQALWRIIEEYRDRFVITNQRVFRVHGNFNVQRTSVPLGRLLDITVKKPALGRVLNYGHFVFESAAQVQGLNKVTYVKAIDKRDRILQQTMQRAGLRKSAPIDYQDDGT